jgi:hypothetical protein
MIRFLVLAFSPAIAVPALAQQPPPSKQPKPAPQHEQSQRMEPREHHHDGGLFNRGNLYDLLGIGRPEHRDHDYGRGDRYRRDR